MTSPLLRLLGAVAGLGSAILCWFLGSTLSLPLSEGRLFAQNKAQYALLAFLLIPALIMAVVALFWVPPRVSGGGPLPEGRRWRAALVLILLTAFLIGLTRRDRIRQTGGVVLPDTVLLRHDSRGGNGENSPPPLVSSARRRGCCLNDQD